jgi:hypothetical protein
MWFVTRLDETRVRSDERRAIQLLTENLGPHIWKNAMIVFTFAEAIAPADYPRYLEKRTRLIRECIGSNNGVEGVEDIPAVGVTNKSDMTPDGRYWSGHLLATVVNVLPRKYAPTIIQAVKSRVITEDQAKKTVAAPQGKTGEHKIPNTIIVDKEAGTSIAKAFVEAATYAGLGAKLGASIAGAPGAFIGAVGGAVWGFMKSWF